MLKRSALYETHLSAGAQFTDLFAWEVPEVFTAVSEEYQALQGAIGLLDCTQSGIIEVSGDDRTRFLHGMLTNDIKQLEPGRGCYAGFLTPQGRLIGDMRVYCLEGSFWLTIDLGLRDQIPAALRKYVIGDRPGLTDRSDDLSILSLQGNDSPRFLAHLLPGLGIGPQLHDHQEQNLFGMPVRICRVHRYTDQGFDLIAPSSQIIHLWNSLIEAGKPFEARAIGFTASNIIRVEAGIPWYGFDMDERTLPLEVGMEKNAISLTKGCYIGQESVARITYRGQVQKRLSGLRIQGDLPAAKGDKIFKDEVEIGWVTSSVSSIALHCPIALGFLRREAWDPGTNLQIGHSNSILNATVASLPFIESGSTFQAH